MNIVLHITKFNQWPTNEICDIIPFLTSGFVSPYHFG